MSGLEIVIPILFAGAVSIFSGKYGSSKRQYKVEKNGVYKIIQTGLKELDYDMVLNGYSKLKKFDEKHMDLLSEKPVKKFFERLGCSERVLKCDKTEKLFNISKEVLENPELLRKKLNDLSLQRQTSQTKTFIEKELQVIEEKEEKDNAATEQMIQELRKVKDVKSHKLALARKVLDEMNLTTLLEEQAREYEQVILKMTRSDFDFQKRVIREKRKRDLEEKYKKIESKKVKKSSV